MSRYTGVLGSFLFWSATLLLGSMIAVYFQLQVQGGTGEPMQLAPLPWLGTFVFGVSTVIAAIRDDSLAWWIGLIWACLATFFGVMGVAQAPGSWIVESDHWVIWANLIIGGGMLLTCFIGRITDL